MKISKVGLITFFNLEFPFAGNVARQFKEDAIKTIENGEQRFILDFRSVPFIDSEGLECLYDVYDELKRRGGNMKIVNLKATCKDIFALTRSDDFFEVYSTVEEAGKSFL